MEFVCMSRQTDQLVNKCRRLVFRSRPAPSSVPAQVTRDHLDGMRVRLPQADGIGQFGAEDRLEDVAVRW